MMVRFVCGNCGQKFKAKEEYAGQPSQCPSCGVMVQIPVAENLGPADILPVPDIPQYAAIPAVETPKLTMRPRSSAEVGENAVPAAGGAPRLTLNTKARVPSGDVQLPGLKVPAAANMPQDAGALKPRATGPKQAFPVGLSASAPKLPPGLRLLEDGES